MEETKTTTEQVTTDEVASPKVCENCNNSGKDCSVCGKAEVV